MEGVTPSKVRLREPDSPTSLELRPAKRARTVSEKEAKEKDKEVKSLKERERAKEREEGEGDDGTYEGNEAVEESSGSASASDPTVTTPNPKKDFACLVPGCGCAFTRKHSLKVHVLKAHRDQQHLFRAVLKSDKSSKEGKKWSCPVEECPCGYSRKGDLKTHFEKAHGDCDYVFERNHARLIPKGSAQPLTAIAHPQFPQTALTLSNPPQITPLGFPLTDEQILSIIASHELSRQPGAADEQESAMVLSMLGQDAMLSAAHGRLPTPPTPGFDGRLPTPQDFGNSLSGRLATPALPAGFDGRLPTPQDFATPLNGRLAPPPPVLINEGKLAAPLFFSHSYGRLPSLADLVPAATRNRKTDIAFPFGEPLVAPAGGAHTL